MCVGELKSRLSQISQLKWNGHVTIVIGTLAVGAGKWLRWNGDYVKVKVV